MLFLLLVLPLTSSQWWYDHGTTRKTKDLTTMSPLDRILHPTGTVSPEEFVKRFGDVASTPSYTGLLDEKLTSSPLEYHSLFRSENGISTYRLPPSPLDDDGEITPATVKENQAENREMTDSRAFLNQLDELSPCQRDCARGLDKAMGLIMKSMSHVDRYNQLCHHYNESYTCIMEDVFCGEEDHSTFDVVTSGLRYMCVDQQLAFNATIECIDVQAGHVQSECEGVCNTKNLLMNWIMRSSIAKGIQGGISNGLQDGLLAGGQGVLNGMFGGGAKGLADADTLPGNDPAFLDNLRQMSSEMCTVGECVLDCLRTKFNTRCEGSAGTLLSEAFVRPIASSQDQMAMMSPIMGMFIPQPCSFLVNKPELAKHRIDPTLDQELHRMYSEKEAERLKEIAEAEQERANISLFTIPDTPPSPLDLDEHNDVQSILDLLSPPKDAAKAQQEQEVWDARMQQWLRTDIESQNSTIVSSGDLNDVNNTLIPESTLELDEDQLLLQPSQTDRIEEDTNDGGSGSGSIESSGNSLEGVDGSGNLMEGRHTVATYKINADKRIQFQYEAKMNGTLRCRVKH